MHSQFWREMLRFVWWLLRLPIVTLVIREPVVSVVFGGLAMLGVLMVLFYNLIRTPHFPTWTMLSLSVGFGIVVRVYKGLIEVLAR